MKEYKDKFLVINSKDLSENDKTVLVNWLYDIGWAPQKNKYHVCNRDEPYAKEVLGVIQKGELAKNKKGDK